MISLPSPGGDGGERELVRRIFRARACSRMVLRPLPPIAEENVLI